MAATELSAEQEEAVREFVTTMQAQARAVERMQALEIDMRTALQSVTNEDGVSLWDALPPAFRLML